MYTIKVKTYYQGKHSKFRNYLDYCNDVLQFETKKEAKKYLKNDILGGYWQKHSQGYSLAGTYILNHNEYDRPDYKIVKVK